MTSPLKLAPGASRRSSPHHLDPGVFGVARDDRRQRRLERVLVVEHVQLVHAEPAHELDLRGGLHGVAGREAPEGALARG